MSGYHSVLRIKEKSFSCGFGKDKSRGNTVVAQKKMELHITWQDSMKPQFIPYID